MHRLSRRNNRNLVSILVDYPLQYVIRAATRWPAYLVQGGEERKRYLEDAGWHVKYSPFPGERKPM